MECRRSDLERLDVLRLRIESSRRALAALPPGGVQALRLVASIAEWESELVQLEESL